MSPPTDPRALLAARQSALVAALVVGEPPPPGFDVARVRLAAVALANKRARAVARAWPELTTALGPDYAAEFGLYARDNPLPRDGGPLADGRAFARWLHERGALPDSARLHALAVDLRFARTPHGLVPRRGPALRAVWLRRPRRLVLAARLPWLGVRRVALRLGSR